MRLHPALLLLPWIFLTACADPAPKNQPRTTGENVVPVRTERIELRPTSQRLRWTGTTAPKAEISLTFKGSGRIKKLNFVEGDVVKENDLLGSLVEEDYWSYRRLAQVQVRTLEPDARRMQSLAGQDALPQAEADRMQGKVNVAKAQLRQADAALSGVLLRAPIAGVIDRKSVSEGDLVSPAREVGKLVDLSQIRVVVSASEMELEYLTPQATVNLEFNHPARRVTGRIDRISPLADFKTRTFPVTIVVDNEFVEGRPLLRGGMKATVTFEVPGASTLRLPFSAVLRSEDRRTYVYVARGGRAVTTPVKTGRLIHGRLEILEGLSPADEVVVSGQQFLREGTPIAVNNAPAGAPPVEPPK